MQTKDSEVNRPLVPPAAVLHAKSRGPEGALDATVTLIEHGGRVALVTNRHVLANHAAITISFRSLTAPSKRILQPLRLIDDHGAPIWRGHDIPAVDIAALVLPPLDSDIDRSAIRCQVGAGVEAEVGDTVHIIGYPADVTGSDSEAIWESGRIATDPMGDLQPDFPCFLIKSQARAGMSGSPVVSATSDEEFRDAKEKDTQPSRLLGLYAAAWKKNKKFRVVWRTSQIAAVIATLDC